MIHDSPPSIYWFTIHHHPYIDARFTIISILIDDSPPYLRFTTINILSHDSPPPIYWWFTIRHHQYIDSRFATINILIHDSPISISCVLNHNSPPSIYWFTIHHHQYINSRFATINIIMYSSLIKGYWYTDWANLKRFLTSPGTQCEPVCVSCVLNHDSPPSIYWFTIHHHQYIDSRFATINICIHR